MHLFFTIFILPHSKHIQPTTLTKIFRHILTLVLLNKLRCQPIRFLDPDGCYEFTYLMANSADPGLNWIHTVCRCRVYPGSAGQRLTLKVPSKICSRQFFFFFFFFSEKISLDISELSAKQTIHMICQGLFHLKNKKKTTYFEMSSAAVVISSLRFSNLNKSYKLLNVLILIKCCKTWHLICIYSCPGLSVQILRANMVVKYVYFCKI